MEIKRRVNKLTVKKGKKYEHTQQTVWKEKIIRSHPIRV